MVHSKYDDLEARERFLEAKRLGASHAKACAAAGWSYESFYNWRAWATKGPGNKQGDRPCPQDLVEFFTVLVPQAEKELYDKAMAAIRRGLENPDPDKAANIGLKVMDKFYGPDLAPVAEKHEHELTGGPIEFKVVFEVPKLPPVVAEQEHPPGLPDEVENP